VEVIPGKLWADIYLASEDGTAWPNTVPVSIHNATPLTGTEGYSRLDYSRLVRNAGKRLPDYSEFMMLAYGVPQGATGSTGRINTGDYTGYGFECVSCLNVDQPSGNIWQQLGEYGGYYGNATWHDNISTGKDSAHDHGQWIGSELNALLGGGYWGHAAEAGARCVYLNDYPWTVHSAVGIRAVCDSL